MRVDYSARSGGLIGIFFFFNMKVYYVFSLESPHRGDSNEYTHYTVFNMNKKDTINYPKSAAMGLFFQGTQEWVRNSCGKRATSVRAIEVLLYYRRMTELDEVDWLLKSEGSDRGIKLVEELQNYTAYTDYWRRGILIVEDKQYYKSLKS